MSGLNRCGKYDDLIARHLDGDSLGPDREALELHLARCLECERLYRDVSDVDRILRDFPGKQVDPPPHLHNRIMANLPEPSPPLRERWGRWAAVLGAAAACAVAVAVVLHRGEGPRTARVAAVPGRGPTSAQLPGSPPQAAPGGALRTLPGARGSAPAIQPVPGSERERRARESAVASAAKVQVIKEVKIFFYYPQARTVAVTGDFNDWSQEGVPLKAAGKPGLWETGLRLPPGVYSYNFIVDGELLVPDPNSTNQMPDGYGGTNSLLLVKGDASI